MDVKQRQEVERKVISHLIQTAQKHGYNPTTVDDGGDDLIDATTEQAVMEAVFAVDSAHVYFRKDDMTRPHVVWIVLGNDGWDAVCDHSCGPGWDEVMEESGKFSDALADAVQFMQGQPTAADLGFTGGAA